MANKITDNIHALRVAIKKNPGGFTDRMIQDQSVAAILGGSDSEDWKTYMSNFHSNADQLKRLLGDDDPWMQDPKKWGPLILAYIVSGGPCGGGTALSLPDGMDLSAKAFLDKGVSNERKADESQPFPAEVQFILDLELENPEWDDK